MSEYFNGNFGAAIMNDIKEISEYFSEEIIEKSPTTFYISDTHFGHRNVIQYENRPFSSVQEMNEELIKRWNSVVSPRDIVVHGGDFALCNKEVATHICHSLNGYKILVRGNHDGSKSRMLDIGFNQVVDHWFQDGILVYHYPDRVPKDLYDKCKLFLYGHVHSKTKINLSKSFNISVEVNSYTPKTIDQLFQSHLLITSIEPYEN